MSETDSNDEATEQPLDAETIIFPLVDPKPTDTELDRELLVVPVTLAPEGTDQVKELARPAVTFTE
jgi:hypothetical protein